MTRYLMNKNTGFIHTEEKWREYTKNYFEEAEFVEVYKAEFVEVDKNRKHPNGDLYLNFPAENKMTIRNEVILDKIKKFIKNQIDTLEKSIKKEDLCICVMTRQESKLYVYKEILNLLNFER